MRLRMTAAAAAILATSTLPLAAQSGSDWQPADDAPGVSGEAPGSPLGLGDEPGSLTERIFGGDPIEPPEWAAEEGVPAEGIVDDALPDWAADEPPAGADPADGQAAEETPAAPLTAGVLFDGLAASDLVGATVVSLDDVALGRVTDLTFGSEGRIATLRFETGGFLGLGREAYEVPVERIEIDGRETGRISVRLDVFEADLGALPAPAS